MENKVIYLKEESNAGEEDDSSQFRENSQFNNSSGETNYGIEGGGQNKSQNESQNKSQNESQNKSQNESQNKSQNEKEGGGQNESQGGGQNEEHSTDGESVDGESVDGESVDGESVDGGSSDGDDVAESVSSMGTEAILEYDPLYMRLTKFLQTGGNNNKNMADLLFDISNSFNRLNENLENFTAKMNKMSLQQ